MKNPSILIVEDEQIVAAGLRKRLQELGYGVPALASTGREAVQLAERLNPNLVLMDIRLGGEMDGIEAASLIRMRFHLPIVYLTAYSNKEVLDRAKVTEPFGYILKPYQDRELQVVIETALYKHMMERKLQERERWFAATLTSIGDGVVATDRDERITFMNPVAEQLTGWSVADARGRLLKDVFVLLHEETRETLSAPLRQAIDEKISVPMANHALLVARDSSEKPVEDCASPILDDAGRALGGVMVFRDISERRIRDSLRLEVFRREQVERELRKRADELASALGMSEERLRRVIQSDLIGIVSWNDAGAIVEANDAFLKLAGYQREDVAAGIVRWNDFTPQELRHLDARANEELHATGRCTPYETQVCAKDGRRIPILVGAVALEGQRDRGVAFVLDLSDLKKAEKQAEFHLQQLRKLAEASSLINATLSRERVVHVVADKAREVVGADVAYAIIKLGGDWTQTVSANSVGERRSAYAGFRLHPASSGFDASFCQRGGPCRLAPEELKNHSELSTLAQAVDGSFPLEGLLSAPLIGRDGGNIGLILLSHKHDGAFTISDEAIVVQLAQMASVAIENARLYTELQSSQEGLQQKEKHLRTIIDTTPACVKVISPEGVILEINSAGAAMYQADDPSVIVGRSVFRFIAPEHREAFREFNQRVCTGIGGLLEYEIVGLKGKRLQVEARGACLRNHDGFDVHLSITQDLSERHRLQAQYLQAQKMEAVGRLAGGVAHDFNNLLTVINGYSQILLGILKDHAQATDLLKLILQSGERAASLTQQLLAYSRKQHQFLKVLNLNDVLVDTQRMLRPMIGEDVELSAALAPNLLNVKADPSQIAQVVMNLAVNARDAMPQGGSITIRTQNVTLDGTYPPAQFKIPAGDYVLLSVVDTGSGMDVQTQQQIFEPFFTTKQTGKGTGLGLATVYGIVKQSGGFIHVKSQLNEGTTFEIYLPVVQLEPTLSLSQPAELAMPKGAEVVLLAEDEQAVRSLIRFILEERGYTVLEARSASEALASAEQFKGRIDLLITDVVMPRMSGIQLAKLLRKSRPTLKVLYLSGYADDAVFRHGLAESESAFLQKPFTNTSLASKVREVLDRQD